jgi:ABC-type lipoprotein release transport system permease subunit
MKLSTLLMRTFRHYLASNLATAAGIALTTAVVCGALIVGDSLDSSLLKLVDLRLGKVTLSLTAGDRIFTGGLAERLEKAAASDSTVLQAAPVLKTEAVASVEGGSLQADRVQVWGIDDRFARLQEQAVFSDLKPDEVFISPNLAGKLRLRVGDPLRLLLRKTGPIPGNTPFVTESNQSVSRLVTVRGILDNDRLAAFNLQVSQSQPLNLFVRLDWLNRVMGLQDKANTVLLNSEKKPEALHKALTQACRLEDFNLQRSASGRITSERVFIEDELADAWKGEPVSEVLTYFVNELSLGKRSTPYSFVSAVENNLRAHETVLNAWLADDLQATIGDSIDFRYFVFGPLRTLTERQVRLKVVGILPMSEAVRDSSLMPQLPGLTDAGNCRDWNAGIPIDLKRIRPKDEAYWKLYKGTPKAYVSLAFGRECWRNRYGSCTALFESTGRSSRTSIDPFRLQFQFNDLRRQGLDSAKSGVDFAGLFAGLGMFILASGLLLTILLFSLSLKRRENQLRLYDALGFSKKLIRKILLAEIAGLSAVGSLAGLLLGIGYSNLILLALNSLWNDIVRTDSIELQFRMGSLLVGCLTGFALGLLVVYLGTKKAIDRIPKKLKKRPVVPSLFRKNDRMNVRSLGWKNLTRNPSRSFTIFALLASGSFVVVVTALNKKLSIDSSEDPHNGTGGFEFVAEITVPILRDLNDASTRSEYGLPDSVDFVQFQDAYDDEASCLNLNRVVNPRILATDPAKLEGRFRFAEALPNADVWDILNQDYDSLIPAIADQSVIQWGLGRKLGDTLTYTGLRGETVRLLLVAGLANSIFQGQVLISNRHFARHFPDGGSSFLLVECPTDRKAEVADGLEVAFRDKGWVLQDSVEKLAAFNAVENTYLSIFFLMGALGMLLGIVGLVVFLARNLLERRSELALYQAMGLTDATIWRILLHENLTLFLGGMLVGSLSAILATLPTLLHGAQNVPIGFVLAVLGIWLLNGVAWIAALSHRMIRQTAISQVLTND